MNLPYAIDLLCKYAIDLPCKYAIDLSFISTLVSKHTLILFIYFIRLLSADEALHNMGCIIVNKITSADKRAERIQIKIADN